MKKLIEGIRRFRQERRQALKPVFSQLALGQKPDALYIGCSDSRVAVNVFASTDPGDLFVVRNVGNLVSPCEPEGRPKEFDSVWAAVEYALLVLEVQHIVVCGHSECGAIRAAVTGQVPQSCAHLSHWIQQLKEGRDIGEEKLTPGLSHLNLVSQASVIRQMDNLRSSPLVKERLTEGKLTLHGWWFDIGNLDVYCFSEKRQKYELMDEAYLVQMLASGPAR
ncbi:MAG: hypothetical protein IT288_17260 [Bdellovibrionales bacterium]|nr:hypothetical protein [Bdellovibrionales bacterium]